MTDQLPARPGGYVRISSDRDERQVGVERQEEDVQKLSSGLGWPALRIYSDNNVSAFRKRLVTLADGTRTYRVRRPAWDRLLADLRSGEIDAVIVYDSDRLVREPRDLEDLIDIWEMGNRKILFRAVTGSLRLANDADITHARIMVAIANQSSRDTARRVKRAVRQRAEEGQWHGGAVPFPYEAVPIERDGKIAHVLIPVEEQKLWLLEAVDHVLAGGPVNALCSSWNRAGRTTPEGKQWRQGTIRRVLTNWSIAGKREYEGTVYDAPHEPIVTPETLERLRALVSNPRQPTTKRGNGNARKYALSGLLRCGECNSMLVMSGHSNKKGSTHKRPPRYTCHATNTAACPGGGVTISEQPLLDYVREMAFEAIDSPELHARLSQKGDSGEPGSEQQELIAAVEKDSQALESLDDNYYDGTFGDDEQAYRRQRRRLQDRRRANEERLNSIRATIMPNLPRGNELRERWEAESPHWQRTVLASVIDHVVVQRYPAGVGTSYPRHKGESEEDHAERVLGIKTEIVDRRIQIAWRV